MSLLPDLLERLNDTSRLLEDAAKRDPHGDVAALDTPELAALWRDVKVAANRLYGACKALEPALLADQDGRGWQFDEGRAVEVKRRFEVEVLPGGERELDGWFEGRGLGSVPRVPRLSREQSAEVRRAVLEDGEKVPGVSAGKGNAFLSVGRA